MWRFIEIRDETGGFNRNYIVKIACSETMHTIFLCNFMCGWIERISLEHLVARCQDLNPLLEAGPDRLAAHVMSLLDGGRSDVDRHLVSEDGACILKLTSKLVGLPFVFEFHFDRATGDHLYTQVTAPVLVTLLELNERQNLLMKLLKKKDAEIEEYRINGGQLSRRNLETPVFDEQEFARRCLDSQFSPDVVSDPRASVFAPSMQSLFAEVLLKIDRATGAAESSVANDASSNAREELGPSATQEVAVVITSEASGDVSDGGTEEDAKVSAASPEKTCVQAAVDNCENGPRSDDVNTEAKPPKKMKYSRKKMLGL